MGTQTVDTETEFNILQFEKKLTSLKDSQDSINSCCQWCLQNRQHHKKIVNAWLNVLKRVKVEQRLILFYLANDVVQYSKKKSYEFVESWGTAIQKATTMVRDERVKHKILRIFKIWEQRGVYNEEFITDLCGLISVVPSAPKGDEPHEFQPNYVINKIKTCTKLESDTDTKLQELKDHNPKIQITPELYTSLKDRAHVDDVEKEIEVYVKHMEDYINALKLEIKNRITLISVLKQAETQLEADRKDVKMVAHAYKMFGTRVKTFQKKLEEHKSTLSSPIPSPDINAPSPSPDSDIELPETDTLPVNNSSLDFAATIQYTNPGYYNPVPPPTEQVTDNSFLTNGFSSFLGSNMSFDLQNINNSIFASGENKNTNPVPVPIPSVPPPLPVEAPNTISDTPYAYNSNHVPLLPPPMPPFSTKSEVSYNNYNPAVTYSSTSTTQYDNSFTATRNYPESYSTAVSDFNASMFNNSENDTLIQTSSFIGSDSLEPPVGSNPYPPTEEYNPEQDVETWEPEAGWPGSKDIDTPESPPMFEKEGYADPIEYHDNLRSGAVDVDHRVLPCLSTDLEDSLSSLGGKDVDHRNLISLTGSPAPDVNTTLSNDAWNNQSDKDYRSPNVVVDQDYRLPFNINLQLPPPPPPPPKPAFNTSDEHNMSNELEKPPVQLNKSPKKFQDNVECTDMDLSDDEINDSISIPQQKQNENLKVIVENANESLSLEPPPPLPDLPDDVDANNFLDDLSNDLNEFSNLSDDLSNNMWDGHPPNIPGVPAPPMPPLGMNYPPNMNFKMPQNMNYNMENSPRGPMPMTVPMNQNNWMPEDENPWLEEEGNPNWGQDWQGGGSPGFRGRGINRGGFQNNFNSGASPNFRGRGRGNFNNFRGGNNFRGRSPRGGLRGMPHRPKGNFRGGNFRGGY